MGGVYYNWGQRENKPIPKFVILDTDRCSVQELDKLDGYRESIAKRVPSKEWLQELYVWVRLLSQTRERSRRDLLDHYEKAEWVREEAG